ncbi:MAG: sugar phosphate isomerase/epimerase, partial [Isosphaeraceae bacterium]
MYSCLNSRALGLSLSAEDAIALAARAGFGGVDFMVRDLVDARDDPRALRDRLDDQGLRGGAFPLPVDWRGGGEAFARDLAKLPRLAEAAAA